jgi:hypothetical protein
VKRSKPKNSKLINLFKLGSAQQLQSKYDYWPMNLFHDVHLSHLLKTVGLIHVTTLPVISSLENAGRGLLSSMYQMLSLVAVRFLINE